MYVRLTPSKTFELTVKNKKLLPRPYRRNFDDEQAARLYGARLETQLKLGIVPPEMLAAEPVEHVPMSTIVREYANKSPISKSDKDMVKWLEGNIKIAVQGLTVFWTDSWVLHMKKIEYLAPSTIRKRVESLARVVDWYFRENYSDRPDVVRPSNPLRTLKKGYSTYHDGEAPDGMALREDEERTRRLEKGEGYKIERAILGRKRPDRQRNLMNKDSSAFLLLFRLIILTGLRLREAYCLRVRDIRMELDTIHVSKSKMGPKRDIPISPQLKKLLIRSALPSGSNNLVFPFWNGDPSEATLKRVSGKLSARFRSTFAYCNIDDLHEHDLRHEAVCRFMTMRRPNGRWRFRAEAVQIFTGHKNIQQFARYLSLQGSEFAEQMWEDVPIIAPRAAKL
jgi:integrase